MVQSLGGVEDAVVVDLFAGSGSFGIECLSRGAERVVFVERNRSAVATLEANLADLGFEGRATVIAAPVATALAGLPGADIAFCDPPYADDPWAEVLDGLRAGLLVGHAETPIELTERWVELRRRSYGKAQIVIAEPAPARSGGPEPAVDG